MEWRLIQFTLLRKRRALVAARVAQINNALRDGEKESKLHLRRMIHQDAQPQREGGTVRTGYEKRSKVRQFSMEKVLKRIPGRHMKQIK